MPVRDGTRLGCDLSLPGTTTTDVAPGRFPAILSNYTPYYGIREQFNNTDGALLSTHGYVTMNCSVRGTGDSEGQYAGCCARGIELQDGYDLIEWMALQPWSDGRVGMQGESYGGLTTLGVAALHPPHLKAISAQQPPSDLYENYVYPGGMKTTPGQYDIWPEGVSRLAERPQMGAAVESEWLAHPNYDAHWRSIDFSSTLYPQVSVPTLLIQAGRPDNFFRGSLDDNYVGLIEDRDNAWMIVGPWAHGEWAGDDAPQLPASILVAWFDRFLAERADAPVPDSKVASFQEPAGSGAGWQKLDAWPTENDQRGLLYLTADGGLSQQPGSTAEASFSGQMPAGTSGFSGQPPTSVDGTSVVFTSAPQAEQVEIRGEIGVHMRAASSTSDANFYAEVWDVGPDGQATFLNDGALKASHRQSLEATTEVQPGAFYDYDFSIWPMDWKVAAGHRLAVRLSAGSSDFFLPPTTPLPTVSVAVGGDASSYLNLP